MNEVPVPGVIEKQLVLPLADAIKIAFKSLKIRFGRSVITMGGVVLGIAFFMSIVTNGVINRALTDNGSTAVKLLLLDNSGVETKNIWLISLSLIVCTVGIMNAMFMAVTERYKEIGTMKCLGALDQFIIRLFLIESGFQGLVGGAIGALAGALFAVLFSMFNLWKYRGDFFRVFPGGPILLYFLTSVGIGVFMSVLAAILPARRAAKMVPADAMRSEI